MPDYTILSESEAVKTYGLKKLLQRYNSYVSDLTHAGKVRIYEGDLKVAGHLWLDWDKGWNEGHVGMIVTGNLDVTGNILNSNINGGPFLLVLGNATAINLLSGGGEIHIAGDAAIAEAVVGEYNDGYLKIGGTLKSRLLIVDDHATDIGVRECAVWDWDDPLAETAPRLSEVLIDEINIVREDDPTPHELVEVLVEIVPRLCEGLTILREPGKKRRKKKTYEQWLQEVRAKPEKLEHVPKSHRTPELCLVAVTYYGGWLKLVPEKSRTAEVCKAAVENNGIALEFVPDARKTPEMCMAAVKNAAKALLYVPEALRTDAMYIAAVQKDGRALAAVPEPLRTQSLCFEAVRSCGDALEVVPEALRTREMCMEAMRNLDYPMAIEAIPRHLLDEQMCIAAVRKTGEALRYIPVELRTETICREAVRMEGTMIEHVPEEWITQELCLEAVRSRPTAFYNINRLRWNEDLLVAATEQLGSVLYHIPREMRTLRICIAAVRSMPSAMDYVPEELREQVEAAARE